MTTRSLRLNVTQNEFVEQEGVKAVRLSLAIVNAVNVSPAIFLFRNIPASEASNPQDTETTLKFYTVCGASDLENYSTTRPAGTDTTTLFRRSTLQFIHDSPEQIADFLSNVKRRIQSLLTALKELDENQTDSYFDFQA